MKPAVGILLTTAPSLKTARALAAAVDQGLAACATLLSGGESHYLWKGRRERSREVLVLFKLTVRQRRALREWLRQQHPYECPEMLFFKADAGFAPYLDWVEASCRPSVRPRRRA